MRDLTKKLIAKHKNQIALMEMEGSCEFQCRRWEEDRWWNASPPEWDFVSWEYRVKPKPVEGWAWKYPSGAIGALYDQKQPDYFPLNGRTMILMREVT